MWWLAGCHGGVSSSGPLPAAPTLAPAAAEVQADTLAADQRETQALAAAQGPRTVVAFYQPTPFDPDVHVGTHIVDGFITNVYYGKTFRQDEDRLQIGGWGDTYRTYIQFDTKGLPRIVSDATLLLWAYPRGDNSTPVAYDVWTPDIPWVTLTDTLPDGTRHAHYLSTPMDWEHQHTLTRIPGGGAPLPVNSFWPVPITPVYNRWQKTPSTNTGLALTPQANNNNFDVWRSSRYAGDGQRPALRLTFQSSAPDFKMPLPRGVAWAVSTELGGWDCKKAFWDIAHDLDNYMSVDFSPIGNHNKDGAPVYNDASRIPITAAARGVVRLAEYKDLNGWYVAISHDYTTTKPQLSHGYSTRYLHLQPRPAVHVGQVVQQGDFIGWMGATGGGQVTGVHLHFGIRFDDNGDPSIHPELTYATVSGWLMKSFQSECQNGRRIRYYMSS